VNHSVTIKAFFLWELPQVVVAALISITDVVLLWYALTKFSHRNISNTHKYQAIGTGVH
jgi:hypothetical protein